VKQSNNPAITTGKIGFLDLSQFVKKIEIPTAVSRAQGDVHPEGNPHFYLDPYNIPLLAQAIYDRLCAIAPENKTLYTENFNTFNRRWKEKLWQWDTSVHKLQKAAIIEYHKLYDYFLVRYNITLAATIEPLPGIPPTSKHLASLEKIMPTVTMILQDVYHPDDASNYLAEKYKKPVVIVPHDVGTTKDASDIFTLFDAIVGRISQ
jgi:zinc/manganese transport system substrate-binding protein